MTALLLFAPAASSAVADEGHPVAIRHWDDGGFTIETMWGFHIGLGVDKTDSRTGPPKLDLTLSDISPGNRSIIQRLPNQAKLSILNETASSGDGNAVALSRAKDDAASTVTVDGLTIVYLNDETAANVSQQLVANHKLTLGLPADTSGESTVVIATGDQYDEKTCALIAASLRPRLMLVNATLTKVGDATVHAVAHNTVAVSKSKRQNQNTRFVSLASQPYQLSPELKELFAKKEAACKKSRAVFAALSVEQLNFRPANGTHTPRWNTEHMMGRELHFFSQIYHAVDPEVRVINLNPAQMPKSYKFAHPDWTGKEEAMQTQRVEAFTRRFAYLLDGMDLNKRAKGSRFWTPQKLLAQMQRHYKEHTENVIDKMKLEGWPQSAADGP